ncbi:dermokine [Cricetulus griseus]
MKLRGSLACLLLTLCLGSGAASPLQNGGEGVGASASQGMGDAISHGVGEAVGEGAKEAASSGIQDALGQGHGGEGGYALRGARGDAFDHRLGEAARSLGNAGNEVGRQAEDVIRRGIDAAHNSGSWGTSGGHGMFGSQGGFGGHGNPGGQGTPWASEGNFGTNSLGGSVGQGGDGSSFSYEANAQGSSGGGGGNGGHDGSSGNSHSSSGNSHGSSGNSQGSSGHGSSGHGNGNQGNGGQGNSGSSSSGSRGTGSSSGSRGGSGSGNKPEESRESSRLLGGSHDYQEHGSSGDGGRNEAVSGLKAMGRLPPPSTRALLYFRRLWENFKRNTPFFNWKQIENYYNSQQGSPGYNWQYYAKTTAKEYQLKLTVTVTWSCHEEGVPQAASSCGFSKVEDALCLQERLREAKEGTGSHLLADIRRHQRGPASEHPKPGTMKIPILPAVALLSLLALHAVHGAALGGAEGFNSQFLNLDKLQSVSMTPRLAHLIEETASEVLGPISSFPAGWVKHGWPLELTGFWLLFFSPPQAFKSDDFLNWHAITDVKGLRSAVPDSQ